MPSRPKILLVTPHSTINAEENEDSELIEAIKEYAVSEGFLLCDLNTVLGRNPIFYQYDGRHLNAAGSHAAAQAIYDIISLC
jgi:lysophospholipase L1-like esterase